MTSGRILYEGRDITGVPAYRRARLGLVRTSSCHAYTVSIDTVFLAAVPVAAIGFAVPARDALLGRG